MASLQELPDELLRLVLGGVQFKERHHTAALVCRRWAQLVHSPQLLEEVSFVIGDDDAAGFLRRLRAAGTWLVRRAAPHVRRLQLEAEVWLDITWRDEHKWEAAAAIAGLLAACARLQDLELSWFHVPLPLGSWLAPLGGTLRRLAVTSHDDGPMRLVDGLDALTALQQLELGLGDAGGGQMSMAPTVRLPAASLTRLVLANMSDVPVMPPQLSTLANLAELELGHLCAEPSSCWPLTHLPALTRINLTGVPDTLPAPGVMGSLTSLRLLSLDIDTGRLPAPAVDGLLAVLPQLHGLTQLHLTLALEQAPACLAALTRLHSLYLWGYWHQRPRVALPTGAWLHGLRRLVLPLPLLEDSLPALASAKGLERLGVLDAHGQVHNLRARLPSVLRWAARQPCLRLLVLELDAADLPARTLRTAQRQRSALCVECMEYADVHVRVFG